MYLNIRWSLSYRRQIRPRGSSVLLFFVSTFLGKSLAPSLDNARTFRGLAVAVWALGMMALGNYVQSSITAIRSAPATVKVIDNFPDLFRLIRDGALTPCYEQHWFDMLLLTLDPETVDLHHRVLIAGEETFFSIVSAGNDLPE
ncbi:hypothetical protein MTO96_041968 [Rhipicephalus appendiculatus]